MSGQVNLSRPIVEALYTESLLLADEVRAAFDLSGRLDNASENEDLARIAMSCEALRTTTRMMHIIAWLLNQRAFFNGEISELALRRHGRLPSKTARSDPDQLAVIDPEIRDLVLTTERLYARIERLDNSWQESFRIHPTAIHRLRQRIGESLNRREEDRRELH
jgi:regulator of CtrA degradation